MNAIDIPDLVLKIIPIIIFIAKSVLTGRNEPLNPQEAAAIVLFEALMAYMEVSL